MRDCSINISGGMTVESGGPVGGGMLPASAFASMFHRSVPAQFGPPEIWKSRTRQAVPISIFNEAFVATKRPPGCARIAMRLSPDVLGLIVATSKEGLVPAGC